MSVTRRALADGLGTALLLAVVVGSGIMGERLAGGNEALALLANALATGFGLVALIAAFGPRSGAHFNPVVTAALALRKNFPVREVLPYVAAQFAGALLGVLAAHAMFDVPLLQLGDKTRYGLAQWWSEIVATFGLIFVVLSCDKRAAPFAIGTCSCSATARTMAPSLAISRQRTSKAVGCLSHSQKSSFPSVTKLLKPASSMARATSSWLP